MKRLTIPMAALGVALVAGPLRAQDEQPADAAPEAEAAPAAEAAEEAPPAHDWEFALQPTANAPGAGGMVMVTEGDDDNAVHLEVTGLPAVDSLDQENRDVNAYTVWIAPSKERVKESTLAGVLTVDPEGAGSMDATTTLATFGVIVTATPDGAPESIGGVPVLTGIPVTSEGAAAEEAADEAAPAEETPPAGDAPAES